MSNRDEWETPQPIFNAIDEVMNFTVDAAASATNHKMSHYWDKNMDGLKQNWDRETVWCNPPYLHRAHVKWINKAVWGKGISCLLIPSTPGTQLWQNLVFPFYSAILWINGRIKFLLEGREIGSPRFDSAAVFFNLDNLLKEDLLMELPEKLGYLHVNY